MKPKGRHQQNKLTDKAVKAASAGYHSDGGGVYLVVKDSGSRSWVLRVMVRGKRREIGLGGYPLVPLAEARDEALTLRRAIKRGFDPIAERQKRRLQTPTFEEAAKRVHTENTASWSNAKHRAQWINTLRQYAFPSIGKKPVDEIETSHTRDILLPIWLEKPETARRVRQRISTVMDWAKASGFRTGDNPVDGVSKGLPKQPEKSKHHAALPYSDVPEFISSLRETDAGKSAKLAFEFLILTAMRTSEVLGAQLSEIDEKKAIWTVPAERMKREREHRIPLSKRCLEIVAEAKALSDGGALLFPGRSVGKPLSNMVFLMTLRRMGVKVTAHGFRSSFRDWASECTGFPHEVCEMALAHAIKDKTEAAYRRGDLFEKRRDLMAAWDTFITCGTAKVVALPKVRRKA